MFYAVDLTSVLKLLGVITTKTYLDTYDRSGGFTMCHADPIMHPFDRYKATTKMIKKMDTYRGK